MANESDIEIETFERNLKNDLVGSENPQEGTRLSLADGVFVTYRGARIERGFLESKEIIELTVSFGSGVSSGLVANWLFAKLQGRRARLKIHRRETAIDPESITRIIEETISIE